MTPIDTAELERAIAVIKDATPERASWRVEDFSDAGDQAPDIDQHIATILNAVVSGDLVLAHATPTAQEAVPVMWRARRSESEEWQHFTSRPSWWEVQPLYAHPPQPSETVAEAATHALDACRIIDAAVLEGHDNVRDLIRHLLEAVEPARAALRALKGGE